MAQYSFFVPLNTNHPTSDNNHHMLQMSKIIYKQYAKYKCCDLTSVKIFIQLAVLLLCS